MNRRQNRPVALPHEHPGAFLLPPHQPGFRQDPHMPGYARLALVQDARHLHDRKLFAGQQRQDAQTGGFSGGAKGFDSLVSG